MTNKIVLPIYWTKQFKTKKDKTVLTSLNWFRNAHYHDQNNMKKHYHSLVASQLGGIEVPQKYLLDMQLYYKNPSCDGSNIVALIEKFVLDALQEFGVVINDNVRYHVGSTWRVTAQDKNNPRCEISIINIEEQ
jgi:hypothetical protein